MQSGILKVHSVSISLHAGRYNDFLQFQRKHDTHLPHDIVNRFFFVIVIYNIGITIVVLLSDISPKVSLSRAECSSLEALDQFW